MKRGEGKVEKTKVGLTSLTEGTFSSEMGFESLAPIGTIVDRN